MPSADEVKRLYAKTRQVKERNKRLKNEQDDIINLLKNESKKAQSMIGFGGNSDNTNNDDIFAEMQQNNQEFNNKKHYKDNKNSADKTHKQYKNVKNHNSNLNEKQTQIAINIQKLIDILELPDSDGIENTPARVSNMLVNELFIGLDESKFPNYTMFDIDGEYESPIVVENIPIYSICEHHFLPFIGTATFKYIPKKQVIGLSKIPRIIDFLARKPQLQEKLTLEIFDTFREILDTDNISIELKCEHLCIKMRGVKENAIMTTCKKGGVFK